MNATLMIIKFLVWNEVYKEVHANALEAFLTWTANVKPMQGSTFFNTMERSGVCFKYVLRPCKGNDKQAKADNLAMEFINKNTAVCILLASTSFLAVISKVIDQFRSNVVYSVTFRGVINICKFEKDPINISGTSLYTPILNLGQAINPLKHG